MILYHDGKHNNLNVWTYLLKKKTDVDHFIKTYWNILGVQHNKSFFIGVAWVIPMEQKLFHHFPDVISVDIVNQTNEDKRPLLSISGAKRYTWQNIYHFAYIFTK